MPRPFLLLAMLSVFAATPTAAQVSDVAVKAAYLPRFARYVTWPAAAAEGSLAIQLCVIGQDPFGTLLDRAAAGQTVDGRAILVRRFSTAFEARPCHIAFVRGAGTSTGQMLAEIGMAPVLTITESGGGPYRGVIHFVVVGGRVRFFIDNERAQQAGLTLNARLLALALGVRKGSR